MQALRVEGFGGWGLERERVHTLHFFASFSRRQCASSSVTIVSSVPAEEAGLVGLTRKPAIGRCWVGVASGSVAEGEMGGRGPGERQLRPFARRCAMPCFETCNAVFQFLGGLGGLRNLNLVEYSMDRKRFG